jgi:zinc D-Ala-D-Ala carboxypeptidase
VATQPRRLSKHFSLAELTQTSQKIANISTSPIILNNLRMVCANILELVRAHFGRPVLIHSGYRCPGVNAAVGGSKASQHMKGEAVDFHVSGYTVYDVGIWISENLDYDQVILENFVPGIKTSGWVHCSFSKNNRGQDLTKFKGSNTYYPGIVLKP